MEVTILNKKFKVPINPASPDSKWALMTKDQRLNELIFYLKAIYPDEFSTMPKLSSEEARNRTTPSYEGKKWWQPPEAVKSEEYQKYLDWQRDHPFAMQLYDFGMKRSVPEGFSSGMSGEIESALKSLAGGNIPDLGFKYAAGEGDFKGEYGKNLRDIDLTYRIFEKLYPGEAITGQVVGGFGLGGGVGLVKGGAKAAQQAYRTLSRSGKFKRLMSNFLIGSGVGTGYLGAYRYGQGRGGVFGEQPSLSTEGARWKEAFLDPDAPAYLKPYVIGPAAALTIPKLLEWGAKGLTGMTGTASKDVQRAAQNLSPEDEIALSTVVRAAQDQGSSWRRQGLIDEVDEKTGLPLRSLAEARDADYRTLAELRSSPALAAGQDVRLGPVPHAGTLLGREAGWAVSEDPAVAAGTLAALGARTSQSNDRIVRELYDSALVGADEHPRFALNKLTESLQKVYDNSYSRAYGQNPVPSGRTSQLNRKPLQGSFVDILNKSSVVGDKHNVLNNAWNQTRLEIQNRIDLGKAGSREGDLYNIPAENLIPLMSLDDFLTNPNGRIPISHAAQIANNASKIIRNLKIKQASGGEITTDLKQAQSWLNAWNANIDKYSGSYATARNARRTEGLYEDAAKYGDDILNTTDKAEVKSIYDNLGSDLPNDFPNRSQVISNMKDIYKASALFKYSDKGSPEYLNQNSLEKLGVFLDDSAMSTFKKTLSDEAWMSSFQSQLSGVDTSRRTYSEQLRQGAGRAEQLSHDIPMFVFSHAFWAGRKATQLGRQARLLKNEKVAYGIQKLLLSTDPYDKAMAVQRMIDYAKVTNIAQDRSVINNMIRFALTPEVEKEFPISKATGRGADYMRKDLMGRLNPF